MPDSVGRASILYVLKSWVLLPLGIISSVLTARVLGPEVKGLFALFLTTQGILVLPGAAIGAALVHFVASQRPDVTRLKKLITLLTVFQAALSAGLLGLLLLIPKVKTVLFGGLGQTYVLAVFLILCANLWITYRTSILSGLQQYSRSIFWGTIGTLTTNLVSIVVVSFWAIGKINPPIAWMVYLTVSASILSAVILTIATSGSLTEVGKDVTSRTALLTVGSFAAPLLLRSVVEWFTFRMDVYLVHGFSGARELGIYTVAVGLAQQLWLLPLALSGPLFAKISYQGDTVQTKDTVRYAFRTTAIVSFVLGVALAAVAPLLLPLAYGEQYRGSVVLVLVLLPGVVALGPTRVIVSYFAGRGRPTESLKAELLGLVTTVVLDLLLIPKLGALGAAWGSCIAYTLYSVYVCHRFVVLSESKWSQLLRPQGSDWIRVREGLREQRTSLAKTPRLAWLFSLARFRRA